MIRLTNDHRVKYRLGDAIIKESCTQTCAKMRLDFIVDLSEGLRKCDRAKQYSDLVAFAFSVRARHLDALVKQYQGSQSLGWGICFHITPGNVPTNFAYSFVYSFLAGNNDIVKLPSKYFEQVELFLSQVKELLALSKYAELANHFCFVQYEPDDQITQSFIQIADAKVVWGGNATIRAVRKLLSKPKSRELTFPDRVSLAVLDSETVLKLNDKELNVLCEKFYNDTYAMDQNACSSPSTIVWYGNAKSEARKLFWNALLNQVKQSYEIGETTVMNKFVQACIDAQKEYVKTVKSNALLYQVELEALSEDSVGLKGSAGYFYEIEADELRSLKHLFNEQCQTVTYFGELSNLLYSTIVDEGCRGVDRIVPIGQALLFEPKWDGMNLIEQLTRNITLR